MLDLGEPGGILVASHLFGEEMRRMVDEPERRREIDAGLKDVYPDMPVAPLACSTKAALEPARDPARRRARACRTCGSTSRSST